MREEGHTCLFSHLWLLLLLDWPLSWTTSRLFLCVSSSHQRIARSWQHCHHPSSSKISLITYLTQSCIYSSGSSFYSLSPKEAPLTTATAMQISFSPLELPSLLPLGPRTTSTSSFLPQESLPLLILQISDEIPWYLRHLGSPQPILRMINEICPVSKVTKLSRSWILRST